MYRAIELEFRSYRRAVYTTYRMFKRKAQRSVYHRQKFNFPCCKCFEHLNEISPVETLQTQDFETMFLFRAIPLLYEEQRMFSSMQHEIDWLHTPMGVRGVHAVFGGRLS